VWAGIRAGLAVDQRHRLVYTSDGMLLGEPILSDERNGTETCLQ
jgi:hypothetical protein